MDDQAAREMIFAGLFYTAMIGLGVWQVLRLLSKGSLDGVGVMRLISTVFILGIMCYVGYTMLQLWT
ncbi:MAG: hypothetical protein JOZ72_02155 [Alphaproteobacteria bacterium]|nr:hypothetical protein [Alphaproteobacteria bacterium]